MSGPAMCACGNHRAKCLFGRQHTWTSPWYRDGKPPLLATFHCWTCDAECTDVDPTAEEGQTVNSLLPTRGDNVDVVGMVEIGERLGVSRQTVRQWQQRGVLPEPDFRVSGVPGWKWATIDKWATKNGRGNRAEEAAK